MNVRTLKVVAFIAVSLVWCVEATAGDKPKTGFVNKTFTDKEGKQVHYVVYVPRDYDGNKTYPVILFLHGADETKPIPWGLGTYIKARGDLDFLCIFPHTNDGWAPGTIGDRHAIQALDEVLAHYKADRKRVYLTGFSMGGRGTWGLGAKYANRWAALVPVAADSRPEWAAKVKHIPIWAFHGADDHSELNAAKGRQAVEYVKRLGGKPKYTEFPGVGHVPDWAYHNEELYAWLKKQSQHSASKPGARRIDAAGNATVANATVTNATIENATIENATAENDAAGNAAVGDWHLQQPTVGNSTLRITEKAGKLEVQEIGNGNAKSTLASYQDGLLVIHWEVRKDLRGYWVLSLNREHTKGSGKTVFIRFKGFEPGAPQEIEGRKVRVVEGVTIERVAPN
jgi:poly(3-hydroxybutyrate) depolymerase